MTRRAAALAVAGALAVTVPLAAVSLAPHAGSPLSPEGRPGDVRLIAPAAQAPPAPPGPAPRPAPDAMPVPTPSQDAVPVPSAPPQTPAEISGVVRDPSGGVLPGTRLTLADMELGTQRETVTDGAGRFWFRGVQPGRYSLVKSLPAFTRVRRDLTVTSGERIELDTVLRVASLAETISVQCPATTAVSDVALQPVAFVPEAYARPERAGIADERALASLPIVPTLAQQDAAPGRPVRVGGNVRPPVRIRVAFPACPSNGILDSGAVVILEAAISVDGSMTTARVLRPADGATHPAPEFVSAALEAVRQWTYTPAQLNGHPVPVIVTITVVFSQPR